MFTYFGSKTKTAHLYPAPTHHRIVEPFAGAARYSLLHCRGHEVWINDLDPVICGIWQYIRAATRREVEALPELKAGETLDDCRWLSEEERALVGYCLGYSQTTPRSTCTDWADQKQRCRKLKERLREYQPYVREWTITNLHYADLPNVRATWFADPPYQHSRVLYRYHCVNDYERLARWCRSRRGQVVVCEGSGADWMPFRHLARMHSGRGRECEEMIWSRPSR